MTDLLERLDGRRHDSMAILDAANRYGTLADGELDEHGDLWEFAGLDAACHPLTALLREGRNEGCVVRDLDGSLAFLWQESSTSDRWQIAPLFQQNLIDEHEIEESLDSDPEWLADRGIALSLPELIELIALLPDAPGPVVSF